VQELRRQDLSGLIVTPGGGRGGLSIFFQAPAEDDLTGGRQADDHNTLPHHGVYHGDGFRPGGNQDQIDYGCQGEGSEQNCRNNLQHGYKFIHGRIIGSSGRVLQFMKGKKMLQAFSTEESCQGLLVRLSHVYNDQAFQRIIEPGMNIETNQASIERKVVP